MVSEVKGCRDLRPLIRSRCKGVLKQDNKWKAELSCVTEAEFGGDWSSWSEFTAIFLRWIFIFRMLRNNADVRRCSYFELRLPVVEC